MLHKNQTVSPDRQKKEQKLWKLLNSPFSLWLLSSVILGVFTYIFSISTNHFKEKIRKKNRKELVSSEIRGRIQQLQLKLIDYKMAPKDKPINLPSEIYGFFIKPPKSTEGYFQALHQEFEEVETHYLLSELALLVDKSKRNRIEAAAMFFVRRDRFKQGIPLETEVEIFNKKLHFWKINLN